MQGCWKLTEIKLAKKDESRHQATQEGSGEKEREVSESTAVG